MLANYPAADKWLAFGSSKHLVHININDICNDLGRDKPVGGITFLRHQLSFLWERK